MIIKNVQVFGEDKTFTPGEIIIEEGKFAQKAAEDTVVVDGEGCFAIPGLVDIHFHGCVGDDFCDGNEDAVACATMNPAKEIGIYDVCGSIAPGKAADLVLLDKDLHVKAVYVDGKKQ